MKRFILLFPCIFLGGLLSLAQDMGPITTHSRATFSLDGEWHYLVDPYENGYYNYRRKPHDASPNPGSDAYFMNKQPSHKGERVEYDFSAAPTLRVPGSWNVQDDKLLYYEGTVWYQREFVYQKHEGKRLFLHFGAANYESHVYVNGQKVGAHKGGFTPFAYEVSDILKDGHNFVVVKVDNTRHPEAVPTVNTDWWNHGGITRSVELVEVPEVFIHSFNLQLAKGSANELLGYVQATGASGGETATISVPELGLSQTLTLDANGRANIRIAAEGITRWSPALPKRYEVQVKLLEDRLSDQIGFRTIETRGTDILLNGEPLFLRGICMHEEEPFAGRRLHNDADARLMFNWVKELNANFVRLAHYPHNVHMARLADELGILVWEEIPVYWTIQWENKATLANAQQQLSRLVRRDQNRASVIVWSMANETPVSEPRNQFLKALVDTTRKLDNTRLISAALEVHGSGTQKIMDDPFGAYTDIVSFNQYYGWYGGDVEDFDKINWDISYSKPVIVSEWGGGALAGFRADTATIWSEEYQANLYEKTLRGIDRIPGLAGFTPWILTDFRSPRRNHSVIQQGWNRKGIIGENGQKKLAFSILQAYYRAKMKEGK